MDEHLELQLGIEVFRTFLHERPRDSNPKTEGSWLTISINVVTHGSLVVSIFH